MTIHRWISRGVEVVSGSGAIHALPELLDSVGDGASEGFFITTPRGAQQIQRLAADLRGAIPNGYASAESHSPAPVIRAATEAAQKGRARVLVALGGGSAVGVAKGVALQMGIPILAIPTTYSGSEFTSIWGWTEGGIKRTGRDPRVLPRVVIQDPDLLMDLPNELHVRSGLNAMAHGVEALYAPGVSPMVALQAEAGVEALAHALPQISKGSGKVGSPSWKGAVTEALRGAQLCGMALDQAVMGLHHQLAHVLGGGWGLPHASLHAVLLPRVVAFNAPAAPEAMAVLWRALDVSGDPPASGPDSVAEALARLVAELGVTETLSDLGMPADAVDEATRRVLQAPYPNPRPLTEVGVRGLLEAAMGG